MSATPKASWPWVKTLLHSVYDQPGTASVHAQYDRLVDAISEKLPKVAAHLDTARPDVLAFTSFPKEIWRQIWSNNPQRYLEPRRVGGTVTWAVSSRTASSTKQREAVRAVSAGSDRYRSARFLGCPKLAEGFGELAPEPPVFFGELPVAFAGGLQSLPE